MSILDQIDQDLKNALQSKDSATASTLRMLKNALNNHRIEKRTDLEEEEVISVLQREAKQRRESIESFRAGARDDLATKEEAELNIIEKYLPEPLTEEELEHLIEEAVNKTGAAGMQDMGNVMAYVMKNAKGQVDGNTASNIVRKKLS
ncbi:MAG: GatB/YqeY domain-containing protein [Candidatus Saccharimonadales bacterium]